MENVPKEFDWFAALASCTEKQMLSELCDGAEEDVKSVNLNRKLGADCCFLVDRRYSDRFMVRQRNSINHVVTFSLGSEAINVTDEKGPIFALTVTLSTEGRCKLRVWDGTGEKRQQRPGDFEQWQVRFMALDRLFKSSMMVA
jgi:hypothetical protein